MVLIGVSICHNVVFYFEAEKASGYTTTLQIGCLLIHYISRSSLWDLECPVLPETCTRKGKDVILVLILQGICVLHTDCSIFYFIFT